MKPYYDDGKGIVIYHGDCREVLPLLEVAADLGVTDPPYGDTSLQWDVPVAEWLACADKALRPAASLWCFGSLRMFMSEAAQFAGWKLAQDIVWEKHNGSSFHADRFKRVHEHAVQFYRVGTAWAEVYKLPVTTPDATARTVRRKKRPPHMGHIDEGAYASQDGGPRLMRSVYASQDGGPRLMRSVLQVRSCHGRAEHPTQKPEGIVAPLLDYSAPPQGLVLDPFMGSGTTLVVAKQKGRRAIGIEIEERYCEIAARRLSQEVLAL